MVTKSQGGETQSQGGETPLLLDYDGQVSSLDEAWWAALLEEDSKPILQARPQKLTIKVPASDDLYHPVVAPSDKEKSELNEAQIDWEHAHQIYEQDAAVQMKVRGYNRGGLLVEGNGLHGFIPFSHLVELSSEQDVDDRNQLLAGYVGCSIQLKIIECVQEGGRIIFSERAALSGPGRRNQLLHLLKPGERVSGVVTNITDFGVFVDLGGLEGLIHVSEISWGRVRHPSDIVHLGDKVEVFVLHVDEERVRVALSLKRLHPNPWEQVASRYYPDQIVDAIITSVLPFGAFARLEEGLDGLIHITEMGQPGVTVKPAEILQEGQMVRARVVRVEPGKQRLGLSLRLK